MTRDFISVIALFEDKGAELIESYRKSICSNADKANYIPHLTLAVYDEFSNVDELMEWVKDFSSDHYRLPVSISSIGIINESSICAFPGLPKDLYQFITDFHQKFENQCRSFFSPKSNDWIPHIGLFYTSIEEAKIKLPVLIEIFRECSVTVKSIRVTRRTELGYETIGEVEISKTEETEVGR